MTNLNELHNLPIEEFLNHMNWVAGYEEDQHKAIAIEIYNSVQAIELEEYEEYVHENDSAWNDANLHSLIESILYNRFTMEEARLSFIYLYCEEVNQFITAPY